MPWVTPALAADDVVPTIIVNGDVPIQQGLHALGYTSIDLWKTDRLNIVNHVAMKVPPGEWRYIRSTEITRLDARLVSK